MDDTHASLLIDHLKIFTINHAHIFSVREMERHTEQFGNGIEYGTKSPSEPNKSLLLINYAFIKRNEAIVNSNSILRMKINHFH